MEEISILVEVNVENMEVDETNKLIEVNVERCEVVAVNICDFIACFSRDDYRGMIIAGLVFQNLFEETLGVISNMWILICR